MSKFTITPDIAELIGAYTEGATLSASEKSIVENLLQDDMLAASVLSDVSSFPEIAPEYPFANTDIPNGIMAMDSIDFQSLMPEHSSIIGDVTPFPDVTQNDIIQLQSDTCAIKSQQIVLHSFGIDIPETLLTMEATTKGYYIPGQGSNPYALGNLLEDHGVSTHSKTNATIYDLMFELAQGHKIIVGVDADELWRPSFYNDLFGEQANHALVVTGIDTSNPLDMRVIITDPGTGDVARSYPVEQFLDAWHDSACFMVATNEAPALSYPNGIYNQEMANFDYSIGHIPTIGNIPYDIFAYTLVPHMDDYFNHNMPSLHTSDDWSSAFDQMHNVYDSFDFYAGLDTPENNITWDDIDDMLTPIMI